MYNLGQFLCSIFLYKKAEITIGEMVNSLATKICLFLSIFPKLLGPT